MPKWRECRLGDIIELIGGGTPKTSVSEYWDGDIPWLSVVDFNTGNKFVYTTEKSITKTGLENSSTRILNPGDIIVSARGTVGAMAVLKKPMAFNQSCYGVRNVEGVSDKDYLYYLLKDSVCGLQQIAHGGVFDTITRETFDSIDVSLPPLPEQRTIAAVLSSLDDKIDLLQRQNKTLESLASTLWRKMFIEEAEPGWKVGVLRDYVEVVDNRGKTPPFVETKTDYPIIEVNALTGMERLINYTTIKKYVTEETYTNWFRSGHPKINDILVSTVGSVGELAMFLSDKGTIAQNVVALRATKTSPFYLYQYLKHFQNDLKAYDIGSVQPSIKVTHFIQTEYIQPPVEKLKTFDALARPIVDKLIANHTQAHTAFRLREELLPTLLSGEIKV